jgi:hypothetical protein
MALEDAKNPVKGVSGPGKFAKRTDLEYQSQAYGDGVQYAADKAGAPLAKSGGVRLSEAPVVPTGAPLAGLYDPTNRPDEPVTTGIDMGAGRGSDALMMQQPDDTNFRAKIMEYMPVLAYVSTLPNTSPETRAAIRQLRDYA